MKTPDVLISLAILVMLGLAIWQARRSGAANPVSTGKVQRDVTALRSRVAQMETSLKAIREDLDKAPTKTDIARLEGRIETMGALAEKTSKSVDRIVEILMENALQSRRSS